MIIELLLKKILLNTLSGFSWGKQSTFLAVLYNSKDKWGVLKEDTKKYCPPKTESHSQRQPKGRKTNNSLENWQQLVGP